MKIFLKRISYEKYDEVLNSYFDKLLTNSEQIKQDLEEFCEYVVIEGSTPEIEFDLEEYNKKIEEIKKSGVSNPGALQDIEISKMLVNDFSNSTVPIPDYILYEKEVWSYLNIIVFFDIIKERFKDLSTAKGDALYGKIKRLYFCDGGKVERTGLRWLWILGNITIDKTYGITLLETAKQFIDPVSAIYVCCLGKNDVVFKAFIRAIQLNENRNLIRLPKYKSVVPTHIRNSALMNVYESYDDIEKLAKQISEDVDQILLD